MVYLVLWQYDLDYLNLGVIVDLDCVLLFFKEAETRCIRNKRQVQSPLSFKFQPFRVFGWFIALVPPS